MDVGWGKASQPGTAGSDSVFDRTGGRVSLGQRGEKAGSWRMGLDVSSLGAA